MKQNISRFIADEVLSIFLKEQIIIDKIMRSDMPQIQGKDYPEVLKIFKDYNVPHGLQTMNIDDLFPIQRDFIKSKVNHIVDDMNMGKEIQPIFISSDSYIIDGHHRWLANKQLKNPTIKVIKVGYKKTVALKLFDKLDNKLSENQRMCPTCHKILTHSNKRKRIVAENNNTLCRSCSHSGENNSMYGKHGKNNPIFGKSRNDIKGENNPAKRIEVREKLSKSSSGINNSQYGKKGELSPKYGIPRTIEERQKISENSQMHLPENREKVRRGIVEKQLGLDYNVWLKMRSQKKKYYAEVWYHTRKQPLNLLENYDKRGSKTYHLDHKFPISVGFFKKIDPKIIGNISNLQMLPWKENLLKSSKLLIENNIKKTIVVFSGRFQPYHKGHQFAYEDLVSKFGRNNVYIATSNKSDNDKSPFTFNEKKEIITKLFGIQSNRVVNVKNPYKPEEILNKFDPQTTSVIVAVGEKDANRLGGKYYVKYDGIASEGYLDKGYVYIVPQLQLKLKGKTISGTEVRKNFSKEMFTQLYPKFDLTIYNKMKKKLEESIELIDKLLLEGEYVRCQVCGELHKQLTTHIRIHGLDGKQYKLRYDNAELVSENKKIKNRIGGKIAGPHNKGRKRADVGERNKDPEFIKLTSKGIKESYNKKPELRTLRSEQFKNKETRKKIKETNYLNGFWKRPEDRSDAINYLEKVREITEKNYNKYFYEILDAKKRSREFHLDHKYSIHSGFKNSIPPEIIGHYKNLEILQHSINESKSGTNSIGLEKLILDIKNSKQPLDEKILLLCGGSYGHVKHVFEDMDLTFGDMKIMIKNALQGKLELAQEKCIRGDSIINLEKSGNITIKEVVDNRIEDKVFSYNIETNTFEFKDIINYSNNGETNEWLKIELENGNIITVTPNHRIYVKEIGYVQAKDLTEDMELIYYL